MVDNIVVALDCKLKNLLSKLCCDRKVSILALCDLLERHGQTVMITLQKAYRKYARDNGLKMPTMKKRDPCDKSSKAKLAWVNVEDAIQFLRSR